MSPQRLFTRSCRLICAIAFVTSAAHAEMVTLDFSDGEGIPGFTIDANDSTPQPEASLGSNLYQEMGYQIVLEDVENGVVTPTPFLYGQVGSINYLEQTNGPVASGTSTGLSASRFDSPSIQRRLTLSAIDGSRMDMDSLVIGTFRSAGVNHPGTTVSFSSFRDGSLVGSVSARLPSTATVSANQAVTVDFTVDAMGNPTSDFADIDSLVWFQSTGNRRHQVDLITVADTVTAVPEPSSLFLLAAGIGRLGFRRRRKTTA